MAFSSFQLVVNDMKAKRKSLNLASQSMLRIAPHYYNTEDEIERCVKQLQAYILRLQSIRHEYQSRCLQQGF